MDVKDKLRVLDYIHPETQRKTAGLQWKTQVRQTKGPNQHHDCFCNYDKSLTSCFSMCDERLCRKFHVCLPAHQGSQTCIWWPGGAYSLDELCWTMSQRDRQQIFVECPVSGDKELDSNTAQFLHLIDVWSLFIFILSVQLQVLCPHVPLLLVTGLDKSQKPSCCPDLLPSGPHVRDF